VLEKSSIDRSMLAEARWWLGRELWPRDPKRARELVTQAAALGPASRGHMRFLQPEVAAWLATHR
jgi:hypothetical protein